MIRRFETEFSGRAGDELWFGPTAPREPGKAPRRHPIGADEIERHAPCSDEPKRRVAERRCRPTRWSDVPTVPSGTITHAAFTGAPHGTEAVADCVVRQAGRGAEALRLPAVCARSDEAEMQTPILVAKVHGLADSFASAQTERMEIPKPRHGHPPIPTTERTEAMRVRPGARGERQVRRDAATGAWLGDGVFRAAIEVAAPQRREFTATTPAGRRLAGPRPPGSRAAGVQCPPSRSCGRRMPGRGSPEPRPPRSCLARTQPPEPRRFQSHPLRSRLPSPHLLRSHRPRSHRPRSHRLGLRPLRSDR